VCLILYDTTINLKTFEMTQEIRQYEIILEMITSDGTSQEVEVEEIWFNQQKSSLNLLMF
jgi:uncharacterized tellurite resistance protein B-like protein